MLHSSDENPTLSIVIVFCTHTQVTARTEPNTPHHGPSRPSTTISCSSSTFLGCLGRTLTNLYVLEPWQATFPFAITLGGCSETHHLYATLFVRFSANFTSVRISPPVIARTLLRPSSVGHPWSRMGTMSFNALPIAYVHLSHSHPARLCYCTVGAVTSTWPNSHYVAPECHAH